MPIALIAWLPMENRDGRRRRPKVRQDEAMVKQFGFAEPTQDSDVRNWKQIRRAAAGRSLNRQVS